MRILLYLLQAQASKNTEEKKFLLNHGDALINGVEDDPLYQCECVFLVKSQQRAASKFY